MAAFILTSPAFAYGKLIPPKYTCDGANVSPPLHWQGVPEGTQSLVLIMEDPDAPRGTFTHWVVCNIPPEAHSLPEGVDLTAYFVRASLRPVEGRNDFGRIGYGGPCPPPGPAHRYFFYLYAVDGVLDVPVGVTRQAVLSAIKGHVLDEAVHMGIYQRGGW